MDSWEKVQAEIQKVLARYDGIDKAAWGYVNKAVGDGYLPAREARHAVDEIVRLGMEDVDKPLKGGASRMMTYVQTIEARRPRPATPPRPPAPARSAAARGRTSDTATATFSGTPPVDVRKLAAAIVDELADTLVSLDDIYYHQLGGRIWK